MLILAAVFLGSASMASPRPAMADQKLPSPAQLPIPAQPDVLRTFDPPEKPWAAGHRGVDLAGSQGDRVNAAAAGTVSYAGRLAGRGVVVVKHGATRTTYEPVTATVSAGDQVRAGDQIGRLGAGHCAAEQPCLHWGLKRGDRYLDPMRLAAGRSTTSAGDDNGQYRLLPASERQAARKRAEQRKRRQRPAPSAGGSRSSAGPAGSHGFSLPVRGPVTSPFGDRFHPILHRRKLHDGTDFGAACGTPITAPQDGTVTQQYFNAGYGNRLMLDHGVVDGKRVVTGLNHASSYEVSLGDKVHKGDVIGHVGETGYATGCHLHLMIWLNGDLGNPMKWY